MQKSTTDQWRDLALQFDAHRMMALWHLRLLAADRAHAPEVAAFLAAPPLPGEKVLAQRIADLAPAGDTALLDYLRENTLDLCCINVPTGGDDYEVDWVVIEHHMAAPHKRDIGRGFCDDPRAAIRAAMSGAAPLSHTSIIPLEDECFKAQPRQRSNWGIPIGIALGLAAWAAAITWVARS